MRGGGGWRRLNENLAELASVPSRIVKKVVPTINVLLQKEFKQGTDPYGTPWIPIAPSTVKRKGGDTRIMIHTGKMRDETFAVAMSGAGIALVTVTYTAYHQGPAPDQNRPARPVLPNRKELPITWQTAIAKEWEREFKRVMNR